MLTRSGLHADTKWRRSIKAMLLLLSLFLLASALVGYLVPDRRNASIVSVLGGAMSWILIGRFAYLKPIPADEPEWWGGLAIACVIAGVGVAAGILLRRRSASESSRGAPF